MQQQGSQQTISHDQNQIGAGSSSTGAIESTTSDEWLNDFGWNSDGPDHTSIESDPINVPQLAPIQSASIISSQSSSSRPRPIVPNDWRTKTSASNEFESELDIKNIRIKPKKNTNGAEDIELDLIENYLNELAPKIDTKKSSESVGVRTETTTTTSIKEAGKAWDCDEIDLDNI